MIMTEELKALFVKPEAELTEDEKKQISDAVAAFRDDINATCKKHGLNYSVTMQYRPDGAVPALTVIAYKE